LSGVFVAGVGGVGAVVKIIAAENQRKKTQEQDLVWYGRDNQTHRSIRLPSYR